MCPRLLRPLLLCFSLAACASDLPDISATISPAAQGADYPVLQPLGPLLARSDGNVQIETDAANLSARVAGLRARAAALRGRSIIDGATRLRLAQASARSAQ